MGHVRLGTLSHTVKWVRVVGLIGTRADARRVAADRTSEWFTSSPPPDRQSRESSRTPRPAGGGSVWRRIASVGSR